MSIRLISFTLDDCSTNYEEISKTLNQACIRNQTHYQISGLCQVGKTVIFSLIPSEDKVLSYYYLIPIKGQSPEDIRAEIQDRWYSGFTTKGNIELDSGVYLFFLSEQNNHTRFS